MTLTNLLLLAALLFALGSLWALESSPLVGMLLSIELMLNAANINFIAFARLERQIPRGVFFHFHPSLSPLQRWCALDHRCDVRRHPLVCRCSKTSSTVRNYGSSSLAFRTLS